MTRWADGLTINYVYRTLINLWMRSHKMMHHPDPSQTCPGPAEGTVRVVQMKVVVV